jgi:molybdenum cofactor cytidylyltransferase
MFFGDIPISEAEGCILAHSVKSGDIAFKKGRTLSAEDVATLASAEIELVIGVRLEDGDIDEDTASETVAQAACGDGARLTAPFTGRCNLYAANDGLAIIDRDRVDILNRMDESLTIATLPPWTRVEDGQMLATVKIIPFSAPSAAVDAGVAIATGDGPLVRVAPFLPLKFGMILTRLADTKDKVLDKTIAVTRARLEDLGSSLTVQKFCDHRNEAVEQAIRETLDEGVDAVLIFGASAIVDRRDVIPAGLVAAGGEIEHFGMPVDPGNLLLLGNKGQTPIIGLPGCARSPKLNGFDWVLERICAGQRVSRADLMYMGTGGLLKEISSRPQPRDGGTTSDENSAPHMPRIAALVLAAGQSRRMGALNKMLATSKGTALVRHSVDAVASSAADPVIVVTGHESEGVHEVLDGCDVTFAHNSDYADGMSTSLRSGLNALPEDIDGVVVCLGDMPAVSARHIDKLIAAFDEEEGRAICVPTFQGKRGNPVLWSASLFDEMRNIAGDVGARHLIGEHAHETCEVAMDDNAVLLDLDTPEALSAYEQTANDEQEPVS